jgi:hypothetical protein
MTINFHRTFGLPAPVDAVKAQAGYENGMLTLPKTAKVLIVIREFIPDRITVILVKQELGF